MSWFKKIGSGYEELWKAIIRPPRDEYTISDLGPKEFRLKGMKIHRSDFQIKNKRGLTLQCSHFEPINRIIPKLPCVIYLHGNSSSRIEALSIIEVLLPSNITVFCFDFAGCGLSEGDYISLGVFEKDDIELIIENLRKKETVSSIGLWGRSMGAATALMHAGRDPTIAGMVVDSSFSDLRTLAEELCKTYSKIPKFIIVKALAMIRKTILQKANFDIEELCPIKYSDKCFIPALFVAGKDDNFIQPSHSQNIYNKYAGDKKIVICDGDHNDERPDYLMNSIGIFFFNCLQCDKLFKDIDNNIKPSKNDKIELENIGILKKNKKVGNEAELKKTIENVYKKENFQEEELWNKLKNINGGEKEEFWDDIIFPNEKIEQKIINEAPKKINVVGEDLLALEEKKENLSKKGKELFEIDFFFQK